VSKQGVAAANYISTSLHSPWHIPLQTSSFNLIQWNRSWGMWSCYIVLADFSHMLLV